MKRSELMARERVASTLVDRRRGGLLLRSLRNMALIEEG